jgi:hypothetical protein
LADAPLEIASKTGFVLVDDILPKETFDANVASPVFAIVKASLLYFKVISDASITDLYKLFVLS